MIDRNNSVVSDSLSSLSIGMITSSSDCLSAEWNLQAIKKCFSSSTWSREQKLQRRSFLGVIGRLYLPRSMWRLWELTRSLFNACWCLFMRTYSTVFFKTRGHLLAWAPPRIASSCLAWPCLATPCHALSCLAWVWTWRFFVKYKNWDSYGGVVLMRIYTLFTIWLITVDNHMANMYIYIYFLISRSKTVFYKISVSSAPGTFSN